MWCKIYVEVSVARRICYKTVQERPPRKLRFEDSRLSGFALILAFRLRSSHIPLIMLYHLEKKQNLRNDSFVIN